MLIHKTGLTRKAQLLASSAAAVLMLATPGYAQDSADDDEEELEEVVVVGSRIKRDPNLAGAAPVATVSADAIALSGDIDIADVLNDLPALLTSVSPEQSVDSVFATSTGQSILQLRALGPERTLVLVDGRRHVSGVAGSQSVDVGSIPSALIERVETLTGGASALYGADAVTGVINFVLKDDFEGIAIDAQGGLAIQEGDAETFSIAATYGQNFWDDKANFTVSINYQKREGLLAGAREFSRNNGIQDDLSNPGRFDGSAADDAPTRIIAGQPTFSISSSLSQIAPGNFDGTGWDLDGNGIDDCDESYVGGNVPFIVGGCWVVDNGAVRPFQDGLIAGFANQFGGDGVPNGFDEDFIIPEDERYTANLTFRYAFSDAVNFFFEGKYSRSETQFGGPLNTFYDLLTVPSDNPFIPEALQEVADNSPFLGFLAPPSGIATGLFVNKDPADLGPNIDQNNRETYRFVGGFEGDLDNGWNYEVSVNYGKFERNFVNNNAVVMDRWFAAVDATTDANGNPVCRSALDGSLAPTTPFDIPLFDFGFFTFNPDDGSCVPANIFGRGNVSQEAIDFVTTTTVNNFQLDQFVISGYLAGDTADLIELPGGPIRWVVGGEYRDESSESTFDPLIRGICPTNTIDCAQGQFVGDITDGNGDRRFRQNGLIFDPEILTQNAGGGFDVWDLFAEVEVPIVSDEPGFEQLSINGQARYSEYSTVGSTFTWNAGLVYSPIQDIVLRGSYASAVRAPNISELFDPQQGATFRPVDPCEQAEIDALFNAGDPNAQNRENNCRADGIPENFIDPLTARFVGATAGNPNLQEETATTLTIGMILEPRFLPGFTFTVDYFNIEIEDAIAAVGAQDIVDNCYDSANFPNNQFCALFTRNRDAQSPTFLGFNFLRQTELNFARLETEGFDFTANYFVETEQMGSFNINLSATYVDKLDNFFDPGDPEAVDPELGEIQRPDWAGNLRVNWTLGKFAVDWQTQYLAKMGLRSVEIETFETRFGPAGIAGDTYIHDITLSYQYDDNIRVFLGANNITDVDPFRTESNYPASARGSYFFGGVNLRY